MNDHSEKLIEAKTLDNGVRVSILDFSKPVAGDRWYVKIICRLELAVPEDKLVDSELDSAGQAAFKERYNGILVHEFAKERNFVDEAVKDEVLTALIASINKNSLAYMANQVFADNLFRQKVDEFILELHVRNQQDVVPDEDEDDEPADFSSCFQD